MGLIYQRFKTKSIKNNEASGVCIQILGNFAIWMTYQACSERSLGVRTSSFNVEQYKMLPQSLGMKAFPRVIKTK